MILTWGKSSYILQAVALFAAATLGNAASSRADIEWVIQPSQSQITLSVSAGTVLWNYKESALGGMTGLEDANGNPDWINKYVGVPQALTDTNPATQSNASWSANFGLNPGFTNSMTTEMSGKFSTIGNGFLSSLSFEPTPTMNAYSDFHPGVSLLTSGNFLPDDLTGEGVVAVGDYGAAIPTALAATLVGTSGQNYNNSAPLSTVPGGGPLDVGYGPNHTGTAGRAALTDFAGYLNTGGQNLSVTAGKFDASNLQVEGLFGFGVNFSTDAGSAHLGGFPPDQLFNLLRTAPGQTGLLPMRNTLSGSAATGTILQVGDLVTMQIPYQVDVPLGVTDGNGGRIGLGPNVGTANYVDYRISGTITATATVPEPRAIALASLGMIALLLSLRRGARPWR